jgi:hypothetical protein
MIRIDERTARAPTERLMNDMGKLLDELTRTGVMVDTAGLRPTAEGVRVRLQNGKLSMTDGPFTEAKEVIGGYAILEAASMEHALDVTKRFLEIHGDGWNIECEVRQLDTV